MHDNNVSAMPTYNQYPTPKYVFKVVMFPNGTNPNNIYKQILFYNEYCSIATVIFFCYRVHQLFHCTW